MTRVQIFENNVPGHYYLDAGATLAANLFKTGFLAGVPLCSGLGLCGRCRVIFHSGAPQPSSRDREYLSAGELSRGHRLACAHLPGSDMVFEVPQQQSLEIFEWSSDFSPLAAGVDLGTTSIKWGFMHPRSSISKGSGLNPQMGAGSEVMSRLAYAAESLENFGQLQELVLEKVRKILALPDIIMPAALTGNPAMIHILLGLDISGLLGHPYSLGDTAGGYFSLPGIQQEVFIPPLLSPFVGADVSSGLAWLRLKEKADFPFLFLDLGTNGEMVLATGPGQYYCTSVAMGPALEGVGLRFGSPFGESVATGFDYTGKGIQPDTKDWNGRVSGSGYVALISLLLRLRCMDTAGRFRQPGSRLADKVEMQGNRVAVGNKFFLEGRDVEEILKVKAAFTLGLDYLLQKTSMSMQQVPRIYLAGALGEHVRMQDLEELGFLPRGASHKCRVAGNTSLKGALLLAGDQAARNWVRKLPRKMQSLPLGGDKEYVNAGFIRHMHFEYNPADAPAKSQYTDGKPG